MKIYFANEMTRTELSQSPELPQSPRPITLIGAGGIVKDAHLPAYRLAGFEVEGIYDLDPKRASALASEFAIERVADSLDQAIDAAPANTVFDLAVPAHAILDIIEDLPDGSAVLIQKPMGENIGQAEKILQTCQRKKLKAAVNFQLRYAPYILAAKQMLAEGTIGSLHDIEVRVNVYMPWHLWSFLEGLPRVEILYHSVHYIDLIRSFLGNAQSVFAHTLKHPGSPNLEATRTNILLNYGEQVRATISTNHGHKYGLKHQESYLKLEGSRGAIKIQIGLLMNYPDGEADWFEYCTFENDSDTPIWKSIKLEGSWYPHAFIGTMASLMRYANNETSELPTSVADAYNTMATVEAAYASSATGGSPIFYR